MADSPIRRTLTRRALMLAGSLAAVAAALPRSARAALKRVFPTRTVETGDFAFDPDTGSVRCDDGRVEPYALTVAGMVEQPVTLSWAGLLALPRVEQVSDFHCVEGWSVEDVAWGGFRFADLLALVRPTGDPGFAVFHSLGVTRHAPDGLDHYVESFAIPDLLDPDKAMLMALTLDARPLPHDRGAPLRVVAPLSLAYKSIKFVTRVELADRARPGWWTVANPIYPWRAQVPERRLRRP